MLQSIVLGSLLLLVLSNVNEIQCRTSKCVLVAPRSIRSNSDYTLSIATHFATEPMQFRVKIYEREEPRANKTIDFKPNTKTTRQDAVDCATKKGPKPKLMKKSSDDKFSKDVKVSISGTKTRTITVQPNTPQIINFKYDIDVQPGSYVLEVTDMSSSAETAFYEKQFLSVETETFSIIIHTNKASFKPGDLVKYRILVIDSDTRPVVIDSSLTIYVYDSAKKMVHKKMKQSAKKGVCSGEYQIPVRGKKGVWQIEAEYKGKQIRKQFEITKTERPNFQVIARTPTFVSNTSTQFSVGVECYYSFGKPVTGLAVIKATPILQSNNSWTETAKSVTVTKDVRGTYSATFLMSNFKFPKLRTFDSFLVETTVQEKATGRIVRGHDKTIPMDYKRIPSKYDILLYYFGFFLAGQMYSIKVQVRAKNGVALPIGLQTVQLAVAFDSDLSEASTYTTHELDANGKAEILVQVPPNAMSKIHFKVKHGESFEEVTVLAKQLHVQVINSSSPKLNQKIQFQVGCQDKVARVSYYIVGRGNILVSQVVDMAGTNIGVFEFNPTLSMAPSSSLVVYYVTEAGGIVSDETEFTFEPETLVNPLTVTVSETRVKPNQELTLTLTTGENSQVAITSVDQNVLLENQGNDLSRNRVYNELRRYDNGGDFDLDASYTDSYSKLLKPGTLVLTDAMKFKEGTVASNNIMTVRRDINFDYTADTQSNIVIPLQPTCSYISLTAQEQLDLQNRTTVRSNFIDTLLWQDVEYANGMTTLKTTVPETVTSWFLTGYSLSATSGLGIMQTPLVLTTFKPFFMDVRMPCSCKMGDVADIQVTVHNYLDQTSRVEVTLDDSAGDFEIVTPGRALNDYVDYDENYELRNLKQNTVQVVGEGVRSTTFSVKPKKVGPMKLKVQTISSVACDTVEKIIMVEPPGKTITKTITRPIFLKPGQGSTSSAIEINMPPNAVPGSMKVQVSVQGDTYSLEFENQQPLKRNDSDVVTTLYADGWNIHGPAVSSQCGSSNALTDHNNAVNNFFKGQCSDGGFRIDGDCNQPLRDTTYTARIALGSALAYRFNISPSGVVYKMADWFTSVQRADGSFPNPNPPYSPLFVEGPRATAYVLYTMLFIDIDVPGIKTKHAATINKAMDNLFAQFESLDILSLVLLCRSAQLNQDKRKNMVLNKINRLSLKNEFTQRWPNSALMNEALPFMIDVYQFESDIVTLLKVGNGMMQYFVEYSNQLATDVNNDVIVNLNYLSEYSSTLNISKYQMMVAISSSSSAASDSSSGASMSTSAPLTEMTTVVIDSTNRSLQSTFAMDSNTKMINVMASGSGLATVEVTYEYNLMAENVVDAYSLQLTLTSAMSKEWQLNVCVSSKLTPNPPASVMEIKFPPGFNTTEFVQDHDMTPKIKNKDLKGDSMTVNFEGLDDKPACFVVPLYRTTFVEQPLVGTVTIQDQDLKNEKPHISSAEYTLASYDSTEIEV